MKTNIIAEVGSNHLNDKGRALEIITQSAKAGADTIKFQLFTADKLWSKSDQRHKAASRVELPPEWLPDLIDCCASNKVKFLCTPFSLDAVELLEYHHVEAYKISSGDLTYLPLIEAIGKTGKPTFLSVGGGTLAEINGAVKLLPDVVLLHCIASYPTLPRNAFIKQMFNLGEIYTIGRNTIGRADIPVGLSSHLREWHVDLLSLVVRAHSIEKHVDLDDLAGPEAGHSLAMFELEEFVRAVRDCEAAMADRPLADFENFSKDELYGRANWRRNPNTWLRPYVAR
jgi:N,N'-diacetyllegionaminate synthase